jgi:hypothetical protein
MYTNYLLKAYQNRKSKSSIRLKTYLIMKRSRVTSNRMKAQMTLVLSHSLR